MKIDLYPWQVRQLRNLGLGIEISQESPSAGDPGQLWAWEVKLPDDCEGEVSELTKFFAASVESCKS